ncbi:hypothetical protein ACOMHN_028358 [Nucella lapillus]
MDGGGAWVLQMVRHLLGRIVHAVRSIVNAVTSPWENLNTDSGGVMCCLQLGVTRSVGCGAVPGSDAQLTVEQYPGVTLSRLWSSTRE